MTEIYLVRHPESELNAQATLIAGRSNATPVTERGLEQARRFAKVFSSEYPEPDFFYASPAIRTQILIDIYNQTTGQDNKYEIEPDLSEMSQGLSEGVDRKYVYTPDVLERIAQHLHDFSLPGGESLNQTADRVLSWAYATEKKHPNSVILAATHGQAIRASVGRLLGWDHFQTTRDPERRTDNVSLTHLTVSEGNITVNFWGKDIIEPVEKVESELY